MTLRLQDGQTDRYTLARPIPAPHPRSVEAQPRLRTLEHKERKGQIRSQRPVATISVRAGSTTFILYALQPAPPRNTPAGTTDITAQLFNSPQAQASPRPDLSIKASRRVVSAKSTAKMPAVPGSLRQVTKVGLAFNNQCMAGCWQVLDVWVIMIETWC